MSDLQTLLAEIDELSAEELDEVYRHIVQQRLPKYWLIPGENLQTIQTIMGPIHAQNPHLSDEEIDAAIDEALDEVRHERKTHRGD